MIKEGIQDNEAGDSEAVKVGLFTRNSCVREAVSAQIQIPMVGYGGTIPAPNVGSNSSAHC
jgi:hypothetical protein